MKKITLILALSTLSCMVLAQKSYTIYDWKGKVFIKEYKGYEWRSVQKGKMVSGLDSVYIKSDGMLRIIDNHSNLIYKSTDIGLMRVVNIINDAKKQSSQSIKVINQGLQNETTISSKQIVGASYRDADSILIESLVGEDDSEQ